jgi:hypothetical protein
MNLQIRRHGPWLASALALSLCARFVWPGLAQDTYAAWQSTRSLESTLPDSTALRARVSRLATDSVQLQALQAALDRRTIAAADPGGQAVEECLNLLTPARWGLERVQPDLVGDRVRIRLSGSADLASLHQGLRLLEQGERRLQLSSLNLRKAQDRLQFDLELLGFLRAKP